MKENQRSKDKTFGNRFLDYISSNLLLCSYYLFFLIGFILRIIAALYASGVLHPDEIYQSLEIAHLVVYGKGYIAPEFRLENNTHSYAMSRSYLFPLIFATLMRIGDFLNMDYHTGTLVMIRIFLGVNSALLIPSVRKFADAFSKNKDIGLISGIFISVWFRIIEISVRPFSNTFFLPILFYGLYRAILVIQHNKKISNYDLIVFIVSFGITTYIRTDLGVIIFAITIVTFNRDRLKEYIMIIIFSFFGWIYGANVDMKYYGEFMVVPIHWFTFNIIESNSDWFGLSPVNFYISNILILDNLIPMLIISVIMSIITLSRKFFKTIFAMFEDGFSSNYVKLAIANIIAWTIFSSPWGAETHKEIRFIMATLTLTIVFFAYTIQFFAIFINEYIVLHKIKQGKLLREEKIIDIRISMRWIQTLVVMFMIAIVILSSVSAAPNRYHKESFDDVNAGLAYVGSQEDVKDVIVLSIWFLTGGETYFHNNGSDLIYISIRYDINNLNILKYYLRQDTRNYFIVPYYELGVAPDLLEYAQSTGWIPVKIIEGRTEIWFKPAQTSI